MEKIKNLFLQFKEKLILYFNKSKIYLVQKTNQYLEKFKELYKIPKYRNIFLVSLFLIFVIPILSYFVFRKSYKLSKDFQTGIYAVPEKAEYYFEIKNGKKFYEFYKNSVLSKKMNESEAWSNFISMSNESFFSEWVYILQIQTNQIFNLERFFELFQESISFIKLEKNQFVIIAKTNFKSSLGLALLDSFSNTKKISNSDAKPKYSKKEGEALTGDAEYEESYFEDELKLANLIVKTFKLGTRTIFYVKIDDFLFVSNELESLEKVLDSANSKKNKKSLEEVGILNPYQNDSSLGIMYYSLKEKNIFNSIAKIFFNNSDSIYFLFNHQNEKLGMNLFANANVNSAESKFHEISKFLPEKQILTIYSDKIGFGEILETISSLDKPLKENIESFFQLSKVNYKDYFQKNSEFIFSFEKLEKNKDLLYPEFSFAFKTNSEPSSLLKTIFKTGKEKQDSLFGKKIIDFQKDKSFYSPSLTEFQNLNLISSNRNLAKLYLSSENGNSIPISSKLIESMKSSCKTKNTHVFIHYPGLKQNLSEFLIYGGLKSKLYTEITIKKDILPLLDSFDFINGFYFCFGDEKTKYGNGFILY